MDSGKRTMKIRIIFAVAVVLNAALIFFLSAQNGEKSAETSGLLIERLFGDLFTKLGINLGDIAVFAAIDHIIRKLAHFSEYAILGINLSVFIFTFDKKIPFTAICTVTSSFLYACTDEFHQYFIPARSAQFTDVLIDTLGAAAGAAAFVLITMIKKRIEQNRIKTHQQ